MPTRTYRTRLSLRVALVAAAAMWGAVLVLLAKLPGAQASSVLSAVAFLGFFLVFSAHYGRLAIVARPDGLVFRTFFREVAVRWEEIVKVEVHTGLAGTLYAVLTRRGQVQFSSLLARHRELFALMLERAELAPS